MSPYSQRRDSSRVDKGRCADPRPHNATWAPGIRSHPNCSRQFVAAGRYIVHVAVDVHHVLLVVEPRQGHLAGAGDHALLGDERVDGIEGLGALEVMEPDRSSGK